MRLGRLFRGRHGRDGGEADAAVAAEPVPESESGISVARLDAALDRLREENPAPSEGSDKG
jgi:hypothetical protein